MCMTTLFENIKNRARHLSLKRFRAIEVPEESQDANELAQAICEEMERLHDRIEDLNNRLERSEKPKTFGGRSSSYDCSRQKKLRN